MTHYDVIGERYAVLCDGHWCRTVAEWRDTAERAENHARHTGWQRDGWTDTWRCPACARREKEAT